MDIQAVGHNDLPLVESCILCKSMLSVAIMAFSESHVGVGNNKTDYETI